MEMEFELGAVIDFPNPGTEVLYKGDQHWLECEGDEELYNNTKIKNTKGEAWGVRIEASVMIEMSEICEVTTGDVDKAEYHEDGEWYLLPRNGFVDTDKIRTGLRGFAVIEASADGVFHSWSDDFA